MLGSNSNFELLSIYSLNVHRRMDSWTNPSAAGTAFLPALCANQHISIFTNNATDWENIPVLQLVTGRYSILV